MEGKKILAGKGLIIFKIIRIIVVLGWLAFFIYNLYLIRFLGNEYIKDPSNFVFFRDEQQREAYKATLIQPAAIYGNSDWVDKVSLLDQCRPMIYFNDLYFNKIDPITRWAFLLLILTIAIRIPFNEWIQIKNKLRKFSDQIEDDE